MQITSYTLDKHPFCWTCTTHFTMVFVDGSAQDSQWVCVAARWRWLATWKGSRAAKREAKKIPVGPARPPDLSAFYVGSELKVVGMVGTLDGKIVPVETPHAKPWYEIYYSISRHILTDGNEYCVRIGQYKQYNSTPYCIFPFDNKDFYRAVRNAIESYTNKLF